MPIQYLNCFRIGYFFKSVIVFKEEMYNINSVRKIWNENGLLDISKKTLKDFQVNFIFYLL